jgi:hypothetical protein
MRRARKSKLAEDRDDLKIQVEAGLITARTRMIPGHLPMNFLYQSHSISDHRIDGEQRQNREKKNRQQIERIFGNNKSRKR